MRPRSAAAIEYRRALRRLPGYVHAEAGLARVDAAEGRYAANGVRTELQTAVFDLDHNWNIADALARARTAYTQPLLGSTPRTLSPGGSSAPDFSFLWARVARAAVASRQAQA